MTTHGASKTAEYRAYYAAKSRCTWTTDANYQDYGGRGIEFRFTSFEQFIAELGPRPAGMSLDRKNNNGHYEPGNVQWSTDQEQAKRRRPRHQDGIIYEASGAFYIRYFEKHDGVRKRVSHRLCYKDDKFTSTKCKLVRDEAAKHMATVNAGVELLGNVAHVLITDYWTNTYLPFVTAHLKSSTCDGYAQIWKQFLEDHFTGKNLREYETHHGSKFLTGLVAEGYGRRTIAHIRSLASGIFTSAINDGLLKMNPWSEVKTKIKTKPPGETASYSLAELEEIVSLLSDRVDAQLVVCLAGLMGLRPSEIVGLTWPDLDVVAHTLRVRQAVVRGVVGTTKTDVDATLPLIQPVLGLMGLWWTESGEPSKGYVFQNGRGDPINIRDYVAGVLRPACGDKWKSLYAFRRGAATILTQLTGNPIAASQLLRHKNISVTMTAYIKADRTALAGGMKLLEESLSKE
jgi:integrase